MGYLQNKWGNEHVVQHTTLQRDLVIFNILHFKTKSTMLRAALTTEEIAAKICPEPQFYNAAVCFKCGTIYVPSNSVQVCHIWTLNFSHIPGMLAKCVNKT